MCVERCLVGGRVCLWSWPHGWPSGGKDSRVRRLGHCSQTGVQALPKPGLGAEPLAVEDGVCQALRLDLAWV